MKLEGWRLTRWLVFAIGLMCAAILIVAGWSEESLRIVVRASARTSVGLFSAAFAASSLCSLWPIPAFRWLLRNRRYVGVAFAASHFLHLASLVAIARWFPEPFVDDVGVMSLVGGGLAYVTIAALAATSNDRARAKLGARRWRQLHWIGSYYIWLLFAQSYLPRAASEFNYAPLAALVVATFLLRAHAGMKRGRVGRLEVDRRSK